MEDIKTKKDKPVKDKETLTGIRTKQGMNIRTKGSLAIPAGEKVIHVKRIRKSVEKTTGQVKEIQNKNGEDRNPRPEDQVVYAGERLARKGAAVVTDGVKNTVSAKRKITEPKDISEGFSKEISKGLSKEKGKEAFVEKVVSERKEQKRRSAFGSKELQEYRKDGSVSGARDVRKNVPDTEKGSVRIKTKSPGMIKEKNSIVKNNTRQIQSKMRVMAEKKEEKKTARKAMQINSQMRNYMIEKLKDNTVRRRVETVIRGIASALSRQLRVIFSIAGAGVTALLPILSIILLVGMITGSAFGILFAGEENGSMTMNDALSRLSGEYQGRIETIKEVHPADEVIINGGTTIWKDVLAVYAVKVSMDEEAGLEVVTMDEDKYRILQGVFWDMNHISYHMEVEISHEENEETEESEETEEAEGAESSVTRKLIINVSHKTMEEMALEYHFTEEQKEILAELTSSEMDELWASITGNVNNIPGSIGGGGTAESDLANVALSQVGQVGGQPYWSWYGYSRRVEWCACFVSWCANQCGYIEAGIIPKFASVRAGAAWFRERGQLLSNTTAPNSGDIIFYDYQRDGRLDHVAIVERCENGVVYTIEGNVGDVPNDCVTRLAYALGDGRVYGFGEVR